ncbi:hypothetical protein [Streptomyces tauricus]|uniref:hypothetical protein n=1 Tax=Streptomyces tauricus TaxID=68274 RepID=UPI0033B8B1D1
MYEDLRTRGIEPTDKGEAYLHGDGSCLYMDVWQAAAVFLAMVFRRLTPPDLDLVFCDEGFTF